MMHVCEISTECKEKPIIKVNVLKLNPVIYLKKMQILKSNSFLSGYKKMQD